jgi:hypothetical protein
VNVHRKEVTARRWARRMLMVVSAGCLVGAAALFALNRQWSPPPRAEVISAPPPPARQQESFAVIQKWLDAENHSETTTMRKLVCANPSPAVAGLIATYEHRGNDQRLAIADAVVEFHDDGSRIAVKTIGRVRPLGDFARQKDREFSNSLPEYDFELVDEGGELKVCDESGITHK